MQVPAKALVKCVRMVKIRFILALPLTWDRDGYGNSNRPKRCWRKERDAVRLQKGKEMIGFVS